MGIFFHRSTYYTSMYQVELYCYGFFHLLELTTIQNQNLDFHLWVIQKSKSGSK